MGGPFDDPLPPTRAEPANGSLRHHRGDALATVANAPSIRRSRPDVRLDELKTLWPEIEPLLDELLELDEPARAHLLDRVTAGSPETDRKSVV